MSDITPSVLSNAIMGKLYDILTNGDAIAPASPDNFFSWETPGVPVAAEDFRFLTEGFTGVVPSTPGLTAAQLNKLQAADVNKLYQQAESFARLVDFIPDVAAMSGKQLAPLAIMSDNGSLSNVYELVLKFCQTYKGSITDDEKANIERFRQLLITVTTEKNLITQADVQVTKPSQLVLAYTSKMKAYDSAALAYNNARINALNGNDPTAVTNFALNAPLLRNEVQAAMDDWVTSGYKNEYEEISAFISQIEGRDSTLLLAQYRQELDDAKLTGITSGSDFYFTALAPGDFSDSLGWSRFTFTAGDFARYANSSFNTKSWSVQGGGGLFGFGASGGGSGSSSRSDYNANFNSDNTSMAFDIAQVAIVRPWFRSSFLSSKSWRFPPGNPDFGTSLLSDGGAPPKGLMPAYPTSVIFVRNLVLSFGDNSGFQTFMAQQSARSTGGNVGFSFGPFSIGGGGSNSSTSGDTSSSSGYSWSEQGLSVPGMQVIGYRCHVAPKSPDPAASITDWS